MVKKSNEDIKEQNLENESVDSNLEANAEEMNEDKEISLDELMDKYNKKTNEWEELSNRYIRLQADFNNFKKRTEKERESTYQFATQDIMTSLLPVLDNFDRALGVDIEETNVKNLYKGVEMVHNQLLEVLQSKGLEEISSLNEQFDPNFHHAVVQEESENHDENTIIEVFQKGYKVKDKVIRPSMVKVSK
ncbi:molecular chaperone GrpE [Proteiniborus ethanoligenes]|uniref:Protein GrpE n=1 Tax=Proteiniborus ethanoligenes TaxID=415015 RepID=A0A1H3R366_9FIRM|nr:nucleotide exchange factor GrpE [Proteiniborus ethanoligenes]TAH63419.1 MAG: nucleotide exchange factor GrpE [Gottschalkiaceae bacterium]SDZ19668.1 molecular chaperone GrpE [Proteiniborus ethanoligenes]